MITIMFIGNKIIMVMIIPIEINKSDSELDYQLSKKQLEAIEFCLKRS